MIPNTCRAARLERTGPIAEVLALAELPLAAPAPGEIAVKMRWAPVNPADINFVEGMYGKKPELPAIAGLEGVGEVVALGAGVNGIGVGDLVRPVDGVGSWRSWAVAPAERFHRLPRLADLRQAAMLGVNPATAWRLLHDVVRLQPGDWVVQNAANSGVGRCLIQLARALGLKTANLVRRPELIPELTALGADLVVLDGKDAAAQVATVCGKSAPRLAVNQVGGDSALNLAKIVAAGGTVATIGAMARQPVNVPAGLLIFKDLRFTGLWVTRWYQQAPAAERDAMLAALGAHVEAGRLLQPIEAEYPLSRLAEAIAHARQDRRGGKILLDCQG